MAGLTQLDFDLQHNYEETGAGILVPVGLVRGDRRVELTARLDTGASDCLFDLHYAELLGIDVGSGFERSFRTVTGSFRAFGHDVTVVTLGLEWAAMVFFYEAGNPANAFVGRRGWLDRLQLGLVHYEQSLYLGRYSR